MLVGHRMAPRLTAANGGRAGKEGNEERDAIDFLESGRWISEAVEDRLEEQPPHRREESREGHAHDEWRVHAAIAILLIDLKAPDVRRVPQTFDHSHAKLLSVHQLREHLKIVVVDMVARIIRVAARVLVVQVTGQFFFDLGLSRR